jgi:hypothetical protein
MIPPKLAFGGVQSVRISDLHPDLTITTLGWYTTGWRLFCFICCRLFRCEFLDLHRFSVPEGWTRRTYRFLKAIMVRYKFFVLLPSRHCAKSDRAQRRKIESHTKVIRHCMENLPVNFRVVHRCRYPDILPELVTDRVVKTVGVYDWCRSW